MVQYHYSMAWHIYIFHFQRGKGSPPDGWDVVSGVVGGGGPAARRCQKRRHQPSPKKTLWRVISLCLVAQYHGMAYIYIYITLMFQLGTLAGTVGGMKYGSRQWYLFENSGRHNGSNIYWLVKVSVSHEAWNSLVTTIGYRRPKSSL